VLCWEEREVGRPGPDEIRIRNSAVGVNFVDTYHRAGIPHPWPFDPLPFVPGFEAVGVVAEIGSGVDEFRVGDRVCHCLPPFGAYAQERLYPADKTIKVPDDIGLTDFELAAVLLKSLTAQYLLHRTYPVKPGDYVLIHAAAGGMGHMLCPWARDQGAIVIGTVSSDEKAEIASTLGCHHVINYSTEDFVERCDEITEGQGVHVVYESIGKDTLQKSLQTLRPLGMCACFGHASGVPDPVDLVDDLGKRGSLFLTRPALMHYVASREDLLASAEDAFDAIRRGVIKSRILKILPLSQAAEAHQIIENRGTIGSIVMDPYG
jgi:NADPH:quinone reductase-like Zn-dependent oxidoreductase